MFRPVVLGAAIAALCVGFVTDGARAAPPVDQRSETVEGVAGFCDASLGQGFIANVTGRLTHLDVRINRSPVGDPGDLTFDVRSVDLDEGLPTAAILASATIANGDIPVAHQEAWRSLRFDPAPSVIAGWWYAVTTDTPDCDQSAGEGGFGWATALGDTYPRGTALFADGASGQWIRQERDHAFRTHVRRSTPVFQPDIDLAPATSGPWIGSDQYDWDGWTERIERSLAPGDRVTHRVRVQNDGTVRDTFRLAGDASDTQLRIRYLAGASGNTDITRSVTAGDHRIGPLQPGSRRTIRVVITVKASVPPGVARGVTVRATSVARPTHADALRIRLIVE